MRILNCVVAATLVVSLSAPTFGSLASKATGKAVTSANLSTNPTIRAQQLLVDPGTEGDPLTLVYAKLDVAIHLDTPIGVTAQDIVSSIQVSPLAPHFLAAGAMPFYVAGEGSFNVSFLPSGRDIRISDFAVQYDPQNPPPPGEVDHALVDVAFNNLLAPEIYGNILGTYTVTTNLFSEIRGLDNETNEILSFIGPDKIIDATDSELLGVPEPGSAAAILLAVMGYSAQRRRTREARH